MVKHYKMHSQDQFNDHNRGQCVAQVSIDSQGNHCGIATERDAGLVSYRGQLRDCQSLKESSELIMNLHWNLYC